MADDSNSGSTGMKAFASILVLAALIGGVSALIVPMQQRMDGLQNSININRQSMADDDLREREDASIVAAFGEKFKEIETQFSGQKREHELDKLLLQTIIDTHIKNEKEFRELHLKSYDEKLESLLREVDLKIKTLNGRSNN